MRGYLMPPTLASSSYCFADHLAPKGFALVCDVLIPCKQDKELPAEPTDLVMTASMQESMQAVVLALCNNQAVLLEGPPGRLQ